MKLVIMISGEAQSENKAYSLHLNDSCYSCQ